MAAPSGTTWGDIVGGYGRIGIYLERTNGNTQSRMTIQVWFWSKYSVSDSNNTYYFDNESTSATTSRGSKSISTTVDTGSGWSTSNQVKLAETTVTYNRGTSAVTKNCAAKLTGIDRVGGTMTHKRSYTIPALTKYTVSYNANGGSGAPSSQTKYYGKAITLSTTKPTRTGYTFLGWSTSASATSATWKAGGSYTTNASDTLYAVWQANTLTVNYYSNYADYCELDVAVSSSTNVKVYTQTFKYGTDYSQGLVNYNTASGGCHMTRTGYTATGMWNTAKDGSGISVDSNLAFASGQGMAEAFGKSLKTGNASVTVYAQWSLNTYAVSYNANGGSGAPSNQTKTYGKALTLTTTKPTKEGHNFLGWGTSASDISVDYAPGDSYTANAAITLYAIWDPYKHIVEYIGNGGTTAAKDQTKTYGTPITIDTSIPYREGYTFKNWNTESTGTGTSYIPGQTYSHDQNGGTVTLHAIWTINSYTLTVNPNGGSWNGSTAAQEIVQNYNTTKSIPVPVWTGHTFTGWSHSGYGSLSPLGAVATTYTFKAGNGTIKAKWDTNDHAVLFDAGTNEGLMPSGMESEMVSVEYGTAIGTLPIAVRKNYSFLGWFTEPTGGTQVTSSLVITKDVTLYAQFEIDASAYVNDENIWKAGVVFARDSDGKMKKGHNKINDNGTWKDAYCK